MANVGDKVPSATLRMMGPEGPKAMTTEELFAPGKKVVAFALPGAFTPTLEVPSMCQVFWPTSKRSRARA